jgi:PIF1-like helicase
LAAVIEVLIWSCVLFRFHRIKEADLFIVDEVFMGSNAIYNCMEKITSEAAYGGEVAGEASFGGKVVLFGGDPRQLAPIPSNCQSVAQIHFINSTIYETCEKMTLEDNMRAAPEEAAFAALLRDIGDGNHPRVPGMPDSTFAVPPEWVLKDQSIKGLATWCFDGNPSETGKSRAILTHLNDDCCRINEHVSCG